MIAQLFSIFVIEILAVQIKLRVPSNEVPGGGLININNDLIVPDDVEFDNPDYKVKQDSSSITICSSTTPENFISTYRNVFTRSQHFKLHNEGRELQGSIKYDSSYNILLKFKTSIQGSSTMICRTEVHGFKCSLGSSDQSVIQIRTFKSLALFRRNPIQFITIDDESEFLIYIGMMIASVLY